MNPKMIDLFERLARENRAETENWISALRPVARRGLLIEVCRALDMLQVEHIFGERSSMPYPDFDLMVRGWNPTFAALFTDDFHEQGIPIQASGAGTPVVVAKHVQGVAGTSGIHLQDKCSGCYPGCQPPIAAPGIPRSIALVGFDRRWLLQFASLPVPVCFVGGLETAAIWDRVGASRCENQYRNAFGEMRKIWLERQRADCTHRKNSVGFSFFLLVPNGQSQSLPLWGAACLSLIGAKSDWLAGITRARAGGGLRES